MFFLCLEQAKSMGSQLIGEEGVHLGEIGKVSQVGAARAGGKNENVLGNWFWLDGLGGDDFQGGLSWAGRPTEGGDAAGAGAEHGDASVGSEGEGVVAEASSIGEASDN